MICLFLSVLWVGLQCVIVAVPGRTHLLFMLTFSIQFLKMVPQKQQNSLMMSIVICMRSWRVPDYESDTEMNR